MGVFERMIRDGHEQVVFCYDKTTGLRAIIAIHDTTLGPALGGCRMWPYESEEAALEDALRLAKGMTYKSAASGQNHGGGKIVIWGDPATERSEELFRALGRFVGTMGGRIVTGTDVGTDKADFVWAKQESPWFVGLPEEEGGSGDTAVLTAYGVWRGMKACARFCWGDDSLKGRRVALQGLGKVGRRLLEHLLEEGARVTVTDVRPERIAEVCASHPEVEGVAPEEIYDQECDIFSPSALGGVLNDETIPRLRCAIVAGSANNQLAEMRHGQMLHDRGILYAPDYVINAGGLIQVADEIMGYNPERARRKTAAIYDLLLQIFAISQEEGIPAYLAADRLAERRIERVGWLRRIYTPE
ncbi:Glu/Leu/Phe/Val dehydrogenase dimerization domain-containing protein [Symbiobacterium terraclitae]|uniref:Glu/Leu/Phe/Val dehydrogenase dimerization domain-containing protein n=1 Tax=Symbiobacterium terraclitae TaxID=557451 RepID=UPI0035B4FF55